MNVVKQAQAAHTADPRDVLLVATPCYVGIVGAAKLLGLRLATVAERASGGLHPADVERALDLQRRKGLRPRALYLIPGLAWFAFIGLAVPAAMVAGTGFRDSLIRGRRLGVADYAHALGSLCALVVVVGVAANVLGGLLRSQSDTGLRIAVFLSDLVLSPLLYLGSALLYVDQAARLISRQSAGLHPALDTDAAGRSDAQVKP